MITVSLFRSSILIILLCIFSFLPSAYAEYGYKWIDKEGHTVYGSKLPKDAKSVTKFKTRKLSSYSSDKVLERVGKGKSTPKGSPKKASKPDNSKTEIDSSSEETVKRIPSFRSINSTTALDLKPFPVMTSYDQEQRLGVCKVGIKNHGKSVAREVSVAFQFFDDTLVPAVGPFEIEPGEVADYEVPESLLPLTLSIELLQSGTKEIPSPKVIVHAEE